MAHRAIIAAPNPRADARTKAAGPRGPAAFLLPARYCGEVPTDALPVAFAFALALALAWTGEENAWGCVAFEAAGCGLVSGSGNAGALGAATAGFCAEPVALPAAFALPAIPLPALLAAPFAAPLTWPCADEV